MDSINKLSENQYARHSIGTKGNTARFNQKYEDKLKTFFVEELKDIYFAENELLKALEKMEAAATSLGLKESLQLHYTETEEQVKRLEEVFQLVGEEPSGEKCEGIMGIIKEGISTIEETEEDSMVRDCAIIIANQKAEHYEIATYGSLAELARTLGLDDVAEILNQTLEEEKSADVTLTELAVESINEEAKEEGETGNKKPESENQDNREQINASRKAKEHEDSDSYYPAPESEEQSEEGEFLDSEDDIGDYRGKNREGIDREPASGIDYR